jgi:hypothetical protein
MSGQSCDSEQLARNFLAIGEWAIGPRIDGVSGSNNAHRSRKLTRWWQLRMIFPLIKLQKMQK